MNVRKLRKRIRASAFEEVYITLAQKGCDFTLNELAKIFPKSDSIRMYTFLMYAISQNEDIQKHLTICDYLCFMDPYVSGADALIRWHLIRALEISPENIAVLKWITSIYCGNPDSPFSEEELDRYHQHLIAFEEEGPV